jgi:hypothetical protein
MSVGSKEIISGAKKEGAKKEEAKYHSTTRGVTDRGVVLRDEYRRGKGTSWLCHHVIASK